MQVTSALKRRYTGTTIVSQSYSEELEQTFKFPLQDEATLAVLCEQNRTTAREFLEGLGSSASRDKFGPLWADVSAADIVTFLRRFQVDPLVNSLSPELIAAWIERQNTDGELVNWTVVVRGRDEESKVLGASTWLPAAEGQVWNVGRTRLRGTNSLGVITTSGDEAFGLNAGELQEMQRKLSSGEEKDKNRAARLSRSSKCGLLLLYPISKHSGEDGLAKGRELLYANANGPSARDLIGLALSFPKTKRAQPVEAYLEGTARWRPVM